jgi:glutathione S-transferase
MKLAFSGASPYARKVMIVAHECGLADRIEKVAMTVRPDQPNRELGRDNPLMKIPTLWTDGGEALYDSRVICDYLDSLHGGRKIIPEAGGARWQALRIEALADGIADAGILLRYEGFLRPEALRWKEWIDGQTAKVQQGLDQLERDAALLDGEFAIGHVAIVAALGWLQLRAVVGDAMAGRPKLAAWMQKIAARPSIVATMPVA